MMERNRRVDIVTLFRNSNDFDEIKDNYMCIVKNEIFYRNLNITYKESLLDTFNSALSILSRGKINHNEYLYLLEGIRKIKNHIFGYDFNAENAIHFAADVMLISSGILSNINVINVKIDDKQLFNDNIYKNINYVKKLSKETFNKASYAISILIEKGFIILS